MGNSLTEVKQTCRITGIRPDASAKARSVPAGARSVTIDTKDLMMTCEKSKSPANQGLSDETKMAECLEHLRVVGSSYKRAQQTVFQVTRTLQSPTVLYRFGRELKVMGYRELAVHAWDRSMTRTPDFDQKLKLAQLIGHEMGPADDVTVKAYRAALAAAQQPAQVDQLLKSAQDLGSGWIKNPVSWVIRPDAKTKKQDLELSGGRF